MYVRQVLGGLAGGVWVLAVAGVFWLGLGISALPPGTAWYFFALPSLLQVGAGAGLIWAGVRLRRKARLRCPEPEQGEERERAERRYIAAGFMWATAGQAILIAGAVWWCVHKHSEPLIWPAIGLVVSLHLIPLAKIFHVRTYYVTAAAGSLISLASATGAMDPYSLPCLGGAMAVVLWVSASYLVSNAEGIADRAMREPWGTASAPRLKPTGARKGE
jgi:hypothetical protein